MTDIEGLLDAYRTAVKAKDVEGFAALYAPDVRAFDMWARWSYDGIDQWREMARGWFASLDDESVDVAFEDVQIVAGEDLALLSATVTFSGISAAGRRVRVMQNRLTWGLRASGGRWQVVHEHTSSPLDFETSKPILER